MKNSIRRRAGRKTAGILSVAVFGTAVFLSTASASPVDEYLEGYDYEVVAEETVHSEFDDADTYPETEAGQETESTEENEEDERALFNIGLIEDPEDTPVVQDDGAGEEETSVHIEGESESGKLRDEMIEFARQFIGNPYVWGGTSLTNGADCSGFCLSVYAHFGISIPRVACDQAAAGRRISLDEALPGDLVFYQDASGYVYHAAMCSGPGTTVQAQNSRVGIVETGMNGASFACRYFD